MSVDNICYTSPPLKKVIIRLNFNGMEDELTNGIIRDFVNLIQLKFPFHEPQKLIAKSFQIAGNGSESNELMTTLHSVNWSFNNPDTGYGLQINNEAIIMEANDYQSFEEFRSTYKHVIDAFNKYYPNRLYSRFSMRYINEISVGSNRNPLEWGDYLSGNLTAILDVVKAKDAALIRAMSSIEMRSEGMNLKFQFGMHNPDYPSLVKKKIFVLDYDAFVQELFSHADILGYIETAHRLIQNQFENSITDNLRDVFKPKTI